jgi:hypothetical protein
MFNDSQIVRKRKKKFILLKKTKYFLEKRHRESHKRT